MFAVEGEYATVLPLSPSISWAMVKEDVEGFLKCFVQNVEESAEEEEEGGLKVGGRQKQTKV